MGRHDRGASLPPDRAFVVRFHAGVDPHAEHVAGRVEHVVSGRGIRFGSYGELVAFIRRVLDDRAAATREDDE